jgi:hypothetical protein
LVLIFTDILQQDEKEKKRPGSRGSAKSKASQEKEAKFHMNLFSFKKSPVL